MGTINGVRIGLSDLYYATLTTDASGGAVYASPIAVTGAIAANINPNSSSRSECSLLISRKSKKYSSFTANFA